MFLNFILVLVHLLLKVFHVLFTLITVFFSLKVVVVHRVEGPSLRAVLLLLRIAWWLEMYIAHLFSVIGRPWFLTLARRQGT
jgi:hypothetical protein